MNQQNGSLLNSNLQQIKQIKQAFNTLKTDKNPNMLLQQMIQNNPNIKGVMNYINQNGGDAKAAFYKMAEERGINPNQIIKMLQQ